jgi:hypothetical protein
VAKVKTEANYDGKYLIATSDPDLSPEEVASPPTCCCAGWRCCLFKDCRISQPPKMSGLQPSE